LMDSPCTLKRNLRERHPALLTLGPRSIFV